MHELQSVAFSKNESPANINGGAGWTADSARAWLRRNGHPIGAPFSTENQLRFRQVDPELCRADSFRTRRSPLVTRGVQLIECELEQ